MRARAWWIFLLAMAPVVALYLFGPHVFNAGPVFNVIGLSAVAAIVAGVRLHRPRARLAWYLFAVGQALFVGGDVLAYNYQRIFGSALPFPSIADALYLGVGPAIAAGLVLLIRGRNQGGARAALIDSLIISTAIGLLSWIFLIAPYADDSTLSLPVKLTSILYPLMDLLILSAAVRLAFGGGQRGKSYYLMVTSVCVLFCTDGVYGWLQLHGGYQTGGLLDGGWILFYLLFGAAALHPSMATADVATAAPARLTRTRLVVLTVATFVAPAAGLIGPTITTDRLVIAGSAIVLFSLVLLRMVGLVRKQESAVARMRALEETTDRMRELDRLKDNFVATVSHELRTPLTSIHGYLDLVLGDRSGSLEEEQRRFLLIADRNTDRLQKLVEDLLFISELDANGFALELADVDLGSLARESLESARPRADTDGISLAFTATSPVHLSGDRVRLGQLLDNVISNAVKFTPRGGSVSVRVGRSNGSAVLEIEDTGLGIARDEQAQVFDRFFRTQAAGAHAIQGTGLGLSISQGIAQAHGGLIGVTSEENVGTTFRVELPVNASVA